MIHLQELHKWRYYFIDLPLWACGLKTNRIERRLFKMFEPEIPLTRDGYILLCKYLNKSPDESDIKDVIEKAFWVKVVRESDAYTSLKMTKKKVFKYFHIDGIEHLKSVTGMNRPIIILTGHFGSFFIPSIAFTHLDFQVYPIARTVDRSPATSPATRLYLTLNYRLSERRFSARYIYTDFSGKIDRTIISVSRRGGIFWTAIDIPRGLFAYKQLPVTLFGRPSSLPSGMIQWGIKKNAIFLTAWNSIECTDRREFYRHLIIEQPFPDNSNVSSVLQTYADRLSNRIYKQPWQWMGLQIVNQYDESKDKKDD